MIRAEKVGGRLQSKSPHNGNIGCNQHTGVAIGKLVTGIVGIGGIVIDKKERLSLADLGNIHDSGHGSMRAVLNHKPIGAGNCKLRIHSIRLAVDRYVGIICVMEESAGHIRVIVG